MSRKKLMAILEKKRYFTYTEMKIDVEAGIEVYKCRWIILSLNSLMCVANGMQYIQDTIVTDIVTKYVQILIQI